MWTHRRMFYVGDPFVTASVASQFPCQSTVPYGGMAARARFGIGVGSANFPNMIAHLAYVIPTDSFRRDGIGAVGLSILVGDPYQACHAFLESALVQVPTSNWSIYPCRSPGFNYLIWNFLIIGR